MRNKVILFVTLVAVMGLGVRGSARIGNSRVGPTSRGSAGNILQVSPPQEASLLKEGERIVDPVLLLNPEDTLSYDGPDETNAVGLTNAGTFEGAIRLTPTELGSYAGWEIVAVIWYHWESGTHGDNVKIYDAGNDSTPGPVNFSQSITATGQGWFREDLTSPVAISGASDLWCSIEITQAVGGEFPLGIDAGPAIPFKGDMILFSGSWGELRNFGLDFNWHIRAIVDSGAVPPNLDVRPLTINSPAGVVVPNTSLQPAVTVRNQGLDPATFDVICNIDSSGGPQVYSDTFNFVNLASSTDSSITFGPWTPGGSGAVYDV
ncbi:hypothetical protein IIA15_01325, partial [candidate division TA06 bacterium]|nr:hypothetical protein [candidate division TA06 bacterium]